jgi:hypothetical protein
MFAPNPEITKTLLQVLLKRCVCPPSIMLQPHVCARDLQCSNATPQQRPRPKPRQVKRQSSLSRAPFGSDDDLGLPQQPGKAAQPQEIGIRVGTTPKVQEFPALSPLRGDAAAETPTATRTMRSMANKARSKLEKPQSSSFPAAPPLSGGIFIGSKSDGIPSSDATDSDSDEIAMRSDDGPLTRGGLRPFPMETSVLKSADGSPRSSPEAPKASANASCRNNKKSTKKKSRPLQQFPMTEEMFQDVRSTPPSPRTK